MLSAKGLSGLEMKTGPSRAQGNDLGQASFKFRCLHLNGSDFLSVCNVHVLKVFVQNHTIYYINEKLLNVHVQ